MKIFKKGGILDQKKPYFNHWQMDTMSWYPYKNGYYQKQGQQKLEKVYHLSSNENNNNNNKIIIIFCYQCIIQNLIT